MNNIAYTHYRCRHPHPVDLFGARWCRACGAVWLPGGWPHQRSKWRYPRRVRSTHTAETHGTKAR